MKILIAATSQNNALGKDNKIIWHLPDDFKRFKELTSGHYIIMGRKTFESFPKPLPNRTHVVITRQKNYHPEGCIVVNSIEDAFEICPENEDIFIIGGAEIYELGLPYLDKIELTFINENFDADAFLPKIDFSKWELIKEEFHAKDEKHAHEFSFQTFLKR
jgi:dihydrofolate reductase